MKKVVLSSVGLALVLGTLLVVVLTGRAAHNDGLARWEAREPAAYAFTYQTCGGMCASCPIRITVRARVVDTAVVQSDQCGREAPRLTIEDVFAIESRESGWFGRSATVAHDPVWGFPTSISTTCPEGTSDCGSSWAVSDFEVLEERG